MFRTKTLIVSQAFSFAALAFAGAAGATIESNLTRDIDTRTVAYFGGLVPGRPDRTYTRFSEAVINHQGQVAFQALTAVNSVKRSGVWSERTGSLQPVALEGKLAPKSDSARFNTFYPNLSFNDNGETVMTVFLTGNEKVVSSNSGGTYSDFGGELGKVLRRGDPFPGLPIDNVVSSNGQVYLNNAGQFSYTISITTPSSGDGILNGVVIQDQAGMDLVVAEGQQAPGTPLGTTYKSFSSRAPISQSGVVIFEAELAGSGIDSSNRNGIWTTDGTTTTLLLRQGDAVPELTDATFRNLNYHALNANGQAVFAGSITKPPSITGEEFHVNGVWTNRDGSLEPIAQEGDAAFGGTTQIKRFMERPIINELGDIAFVASFDRSARVGDAVWVDHVSGDLEAFARSGDQAPGAEPGEVFNGIYDYAMNNNGQVAFRARLLGPGNTASGGIWATDADGELVLLVRAGDVIDVDERNGFEDFRTIKDLRSLADNNQAVGGGASSFNDQGDFVFRAVFTDGSEAILVATVPEPGSLAVLALGAPLLIRRRRGVA